MAAGRARARADQSALRVNAAAELLGTGVAVSEVARRYRVSERQARRYVDAARHSGPVPVPKAKVVFTVKVETGVGRRVRGYARSTGRTISDVVSQALEEFLGKVRAGPRGGR